MRDSSVAVVTLVLITGLVAPVTVGTAVAQNDGNEPNDEFATATPIEPGTYDGLVIDGEEYDYYAVELSEGETLDVNIEHVEDIPGDVNVGIYNPDGDNVARDDDFSDPTSDTVRVRSAAQAEQTGTYYILVSGVEEDVQIDYSLSVAVAANDRFEPNGDFAGVTPLESGTYDDLTMLSGEFDYYAVELDAGETLNATITYADGTELEPDLDIDGPDGDRLQFSEEYTSITSDTVTRRATVEARQSGTYYVQISGYDDLQTEVSYSLTVGVAENDRFEPNGNYASATALGPGTYENLSILTDEHDYYAVDLSAGETLNATLSYDESVQVYPDLDINDPDGDLERDGESSSDPTSSNVTQSATIEAELNGTYYVEVSGGGDYQGESTYSLLIDAPEQSTATPTATDTPTATQTEKATATPTATATELATDTPTATEITTDTPTPDATEGDDEDPETTTSENGPGMGLLVAVAGLLAGALLAARRP